jgi:hypothetical protein
LNYVLNIQCYQQEIDSKMEITTGNTSVSKSKSRVGKSGIKRMNKKEASEWFQSLSHIEQLLVKQEANASSSSKDKKTKKEMHERERELLLKRRSEHEARMKAQLQSKAEITKQIQKCQEMRRQLIPYHMRLYQMRLKQMHLHDDDYTRSSHFQFKLGMMECGISNQIRLIQNEEKVLFDMQHKHHFIKKSITEIIEKRKTSPFSKLYTRVQTKNYVDDVYKMVAV